MKPCNPYKPKTSVSS